MDISSHQIKIWKVGKWLKIVRHGLWTGRDLSTAKAMEVSQHLSSFQVSFHGVAFLRMGTASLYYGTLSAKNYLTALYGWCAPVIEFPTPIMLNIGYHVRTICKFTFPRKFISWAPPQVGRNTFRSLSLHNYYFPVINSMFHNAVQSSEISSQFSMAI